MACTIVPRPFQIYQNVTMTGLVQGQSLRLILTKSFWNIDNLAIIFVIYNLCNKSFPLVSVHDIDLQLWPSSKVKFWKLWWLINYFNISLSISSSIFNWFSWLSPARQYQEEPYAEINYCPAKCGVPYSDRSVCLSVCASLWLERNGSVHFTVPRCDIFTKLAPTVHLDMIYCYHVVVCVLDVHFTLEWPWLGRIG